MSDPRIEKIARKTPDQVSFDDWREALNAHRELKYWYESDKHHDFLNLVLTGIAVLDREAKWEEAVTFADSVLAERDNNGLDLDPGLLTTVVYCKALALAHIIGYEEALDFYFSYARENPESLLLGACAFHLGQILISEMNNDPKKSGLPPDGLARLLRKVLILRFPGLEIPSYVEEACQSETLTREELSGILERVWSLIV